MVAHSPKPEFPSLGTTDIWNQINLCCEREAVLCIVGCLEASLTSLHKVASKAHAYTPQLWPPKMSSDISLCPLWCKLATVENYIEYMIHPTSWLLPLSHLRLYSISLT